MAAIAALGVDTHRDTTLTAKFENPFNEIPAFLDQHIGHFCPNSGSDVRSVAMAACLSQDTPMPVPGPMEIRPHIQFRALLHGGCTQLK